MARHFITYGDAHFAGACRRIVKEALATGEFDVVKAYSPEDVSAQLKASEIFAEHRGAGYWSWKPDIIVSEFESMEDGDILVYADAGCELVSGIGWRKYWNCLKQWELVAQRIYQATEKWTRKTIVDEFSDNPRYWLKSCQFMATVVIAKKTPSTMAFFNEWRAYMIERPDMVRDVSAEELKNESACFIENRHDQAIFSALVYRHIEQGFVYCCWETVENQSLLGFQVIRAMRLRSDIRVSIWRRIKEIFLRAAKTLFLKPYWQFRQLCVEGGNV